jgi:uncharacterized damage-inducible protein DinB
MSLIHTLTLYNTWANELICDHILKVSDKADLSIESSFPSLRKTLYHIWDAQVIWITRMHGESLKGFPSRDFTGTLEEACKGINGSSKEITSLVEANEKEKIITYHTLKGEVFSSTIEEIATHVVNHGTYHRGQLVTMLRQAGFKELRSTDFIGFCRLSK